MDDLLMNGRSARPIGTRASSTRSPRPHACVLRPRGRLVRAGRPLKTVGAAMGANPNSSHSRKRQGREAGNTLSSRGFAK
jgi:hypothetical protein